jgi:hypothetical protein
MQGVRNLAALYLDRPPQPSESEAYMGRVLIGVVIGVILVIWLLASCVNALF